MTKRIHYIINFILLGIIGLIIVSGIYKDNTREDRCIAFVDGVYSSILTMEVMAGAEMSDDNKLAILRGAIQCQESDFT